MNKLFVQRAAFLLSFAAMTTVSSGLSAEAAQTTDFGSEVLPSSLTEVSISNSPVPAEWDNQLVSGQSEPPVMLSNEGFHNQPVPGTAKTSATALLESSTTAPSSVTTAIDSPTVAQAELDPGRDTPSGFSYLGIGGNIGLGGDTALGEFGFTIFSKLRLSRNFSFRPAVVINEDVDFLLPLTYDFPIYAEPFERINLSPYVGGGLLITTSSDSNIGGLITGGVDLPISNQFVANASANFGFTSDTVSLGVSLGIAYNFTGFGF